MSDPQTVEAEVPIAYVEWPGQDPPVLYLHATGFHKWVWHKLARAVGRRALALDLRGHGDSGKPEGAYDWEMMAQDVLAVVDELGLPTPLDGVGHSLGGAMLVLAETARPGTFRRLVLFEPIVYQARPGQVSKDHPLAVGARRRRMVFPSRADATGRFLAKPPMDKWDPEVMDDYVGHGLFEGPDGSWQLKCPGAIESLVYEGSGSHRGWRDLSKVRCPVLVARGSDLSSYPAQLAPEQAERLPRGRLFTLEGAGHFLPMEQPARCARVVADFLRE